MNNVEKPIAITNDLDGVHLWAPPPLQTFLRLLTRKWCLPEEVGTLQESIPPVGSVDMVIETVKYRLSMLFRQYEWLKPEGVIGLKGFSEVGKKHGRDLTFFALSGRETGKNDATKLAFEEAGYGQYFSPSWLLNKGINAVAWKELQARRLAERGYTVIHLEDDLLPALCVARVDQCYVYLLENLSNHPKLLQWAGVNLPDNLIPVGNLQEAVKDFDQRLKSNVI